MRRYQIELPACSFVLDVLDGAVLVSNEGKVCEMRSSDCRADPAGLWGLSEGEFDPKKAADMLAARADVEKTMRGNFRALYDRNKKKKKAEIQSFESRLAFHHGAKKSADLTPKKLNLVIAPYG